MLLERFVAIYRLKYRKSGIVDRTVSNGSMSANMEMIQNQIGGCLTNLCMHFDLCGFPSFSLITTIPPHPIFPGNLLAVIIIFMRLILECKIQYTCVHKWVLFATNIYIVTSSSIY